jgi:hypothetical protein
MQSTGTMKMNFKGMAALMLALCLMACLLPMSASAGVYGVNGKDKLIEAINGSDSFNTITLMGNIMNVQDTIFIPSGKNIELNLGGYTISNMGYRNDKVAKDLYMAELPIIAVEKGATLSIKNFKFSGDVVNSSTGGIAVANQGTLIIEGGTYTGEGERSVGISNSGSLTLIKGTLNGNGKNSTALLNNGTYVNRGGAVLAKGFNAKIVVDNSVSSQTVSVTAVPTKAKVILDGREISFDSYNIKGNNYFKLRDVAYSLNGSNKRFSVTWNGDRQIIALDPGKNYVALGGEMSSKGTASVVARAGAHAVYIKNIQKYFMGYNIGGNNYYMLRDIAREMDFGVTWDAVGNRILINTNAKYVPE